MTSHLQGKRHRRLFEEQRKRREEAECSIFVRGFPPTTSPQQLHMFFSGFGAVTNVFLESERVGTHTGVGSHLFAASNCNNSQPFSVP